MPNKPTAGGSDLPKLSRPAQRAFAAAGLTTLDDFARLTQAEVAKLHGVGPASIEAIRRALQARGQSFR